MDDSRLIDARLIIEYERRSDISTESSDGKNLKKKWPKELVLSPDQTFKDKAFYQIAVEEKRSRLWGWGIVGGVATIALFPMWPDFVKLIIFYISLYMLILIVGLSF